MNELDLTGKYIVVTGAGSGIGKQTALLLAAHGALVAGIDKNEVNLIKTVSEAEGKPGKVLSFPLDISIEERVMSTFTEISAAGEDKIDGVVNIAGIEYNDLGNILEMPMEKLREIMEVNFWGSVYCVRAACPFLQAGASIVNTSSIQGRAAHKPGTSYQASKSALIGFTKALAIELAPRQIRANCILPGAISTEGMGAVRGDDSGIIDRYRDIIPMERRGSAQEIAGVILFLLSPLSSYMSGSEVAIDGGWLANITPSNPKQRKSYVANDPDAPA